MLPTHILVRIKLVKYLKRLLFDQTYWSNFPVHTRVPEELLGKLKNVRRSANDKLKKAGVDTFQGMMDELDKHDSYLENLGPTWPLDKQWLVQNAEKVVA